jgi:hypothetical protein
MNFTIEEDMNLTDNFNANDFLLHNIHTKRKTCHSCRRICSKLCNGSCCKCAMIFLCITMLNGFSFLMGAYYEEKFQHKLFHNNSQDL